MAATGDERLLRWSADHVELEICLSGCGHEPKRSLDPLVERPARLLQFVPDRPSTVRIMVVANQRHTRLPVWQRLSAELAAGFFFAWRWTFKKDGLAGNFWSGHFSPWDRLA